MSDEIKDPFGLTFKERQEIDDAVLATLGSLKQENTLVADTPTGRVQRLLKLLVGFRPVLAIFARIPIPGLSRTAVATILQALDAIIGLIPNVVVQFKAGRDLEEITSDAGDTGTEVKAAS